MLAESADPEMHFFLDVVFDEDADIVALGLQGRLENDFRSNTKMLEVSEGCVRVNLSLPSHMAFDGRDLRELLVEDPGIEDTLYFYRVSHVLYRCFPKTKEFDSTGILRYPKDWK